MSSRQMRRQAERAKQKIVAKLWHPMQETSTIRKGDGTLAPAPEGERWFGNNTYTAVLRRVVNDDPNKPVLLWISYHRLDRAAARDWRDAQRIKNDIVGAEQEMVELYPAESRVVDLANEFHLWGLEGITLDAFGFNDGRQVEGQEDTLAFPGAQQRPNPNETINEGDSSE